MQNEWTRELQLELESMMCRPEFLKLIGWTKKDMALTLRQASYRRGFHLLMSEPRFTCRKILELARPTISLFSPEPPEGWLEYCFLWGKHTLYPENFADHSRPECEWGRIFYLEFLHALLSIEEKAKGFSPLLYFQFAAEEECKGCSAEREYLTFLKFCRDTCLVEFMRIGSEITPFNTLGHIAGVHHIAMSMARQLHHLGVNVDLALMSGAAIGHDIGKYGCKESEARRVPYLHYYYTDQCMTRNGMPFIAHIAANHSTWDMELENLSVESLLLIYADFRVKSVRGADRQEKVIFYSLADSFQVILDKLDNVDQAKLERYRRVYDKLKDFEEYMISLGVDTIRPEARPERLPQVDSALLCGDQIVRAYKNSAIEHNINFMHILNRESAFGNILEAARSEKDWKNTRSYLNILEEYCTYMNQKQKQLTISFLYELLIHREGDIRRKAAALMGKMIVNYDVEYRKEIPDGLMAFQQDGSSKELFARYYQKILEPDHKIMEKHREWLGYMLEYFADSVFKNCKPSRKAEYLQDFLEAYKNPDRDWFTIFIMLTALLKLPLELCTHEQHEIINHFLKQALQNDHLELRVAILRATEMFLDRFPENELVLENSRQIMEKLPDQPIISIQFLKLKIAEKLDLISPAMDILEKEYGKRGLISACFLENLKAATPWICKQTNIEFLLYLMTKGQNDQPVHTTTHLANLLTVSECQDVRRRAGEILVEFARYVSLDQRNEVAVELLKGLELGESELAKYVPTYLGQLILLLQPAEIDEFLESLENMFVHANDQTAGVILDTFGVLVENYPSYRLICSESEEVFQARLYRMLGFLMRGLANYHQTVTQEAFYVIGEHIFGSRKLSLTEKHRIFCYMSKKTYHILFDQKEQRLDFLIHAAGLNHIYRFLADYFFSYGDFRIPEDGRVAFFPGTFDPFSLSHLGIVKEIRAHGFEVYLAIDEFSWSKKTQPRLIRRKIAAMSVADDSGVFLFPDDVPVNIANPKDLERLSSLFPTKELYMVIGSDVLEHASAYQKAPRPYSIHNFNHIIFRRNSEQTQLEKEGEGISESSIQGKILELSLPMQLEDISSTRIRDNIDLNRDISNLIDPVAQNYIYDNNLYLREPQYKPVIDARELSYRPVKDITPALKDLLAETVLKGKKRRADVLQALNQDGLELFVISNEENDSRPLAFAMCRALANHELLQEFGDFELTNTIRDHISGKLLLLLGLYVADDCADIADMRQLLLTETLAEAMKEEYTCCLYHGLPELEERKNQQIDLLLRQGFLRLDDNSREDTIMVVDMHMPTTLTKNLAMTIKAPFNTNPRVLKTLDMAHQRLQRVLTRLRPGQLVLSFDSTVMHQRLVDKITEENQVPNHVVTPRKLGEKMCVPFGKMLRGSVVPNTVTKALHTERVFHIDMKGFTIEEFPNYSPLRTQIRTIQSFDRGVLLVDDLLHKGYRLREMYHLIAEENLKIDKLIMGILTARGKDLVTSFGQEVDSVYFLPNLHSWYVESTMYPFIGGDSVEGGTRTPGLLTSVNLILPYVAPAFLVRESPATAYDISMVCLENARDILLTLEQEYQKEFERNLTLERLSEVIYSPTCPDKGYFMSYDMNLKASLYVENDIKRLIRLHNMAGIQ